jgi:hypothetical protein
VTEASWDPWPTAKTWTLLEASYICCGERPVTNDQRRLTKTAHPAHIHAMAQRLRAEVPNEKVRTPFWRTYDWIFQREAVETWAKQNGFRLPWEASAESRSDSVPLETHLRVLGLLAHLLAEKADRYHHGEKPNVSKIAEAVEGILAKLPGVNRRGLSNTRIRESIAAGLSQLTTDDKN